MSQFLRHTDEYSGHYTARMDFDDAVKLPGGGSTCDIYRTRWQRRDVFIKRLKEEYRSKPLYLDALDKEFNIGVNLKHPSLPDYREFHRDYIIMDFIDGATLAEMMKCKDRWLTKESNIISMLKELVEVVDYLHRHDVVHCDIKPDNIMIRSNTRHLVLIDFDKCYSDALNDTSGHPGKYGLSIEERGRILIDFKGIERVVEMLKSGVTGFKFRRYSRFVKACNRPDVTCAELINILDYAPRVSHKMARFTIMATVVGLLVLSGLYLFRHEERENISSERLKTTTESLPKEAAINTDGKTETEDVVESGSTETTADYREDTPKGATLDAQQKAILLDKRILPSFSKLMSNLDRLNALKNDTTATGEQLLTCIRNHQMMADEALKSTFEILNEISPGMNEKDAWKILAYSKSYTGYTRRATPELREFGQEIARRMAAESGGRP